jgi:hypothetical protein
MKGSISWLPFVIGLCLASFVACDTSSEDIVGKWHLAADGSAMVWEFSKDGSVLVGTTRGRYRFGDNKRIKIETGFSTAVYQIEFITGRMILRNANGSKLEFTKSQ